MSNLVYYWHKLAYQLVHQTTLWMLIVFFATALASWVLSSVLEKHNDRTREAQFARKTAVFYAAAATFFWLFSIIFK